MTNYPWYFPIIFEAFRKRWVKFTDIEDTLKFSNIDDSLECNDIEDSIKFTEVIQ